MTLEASVLTKACLPSILAVLMHLELVSCSAVDYLQNIQVACSVSLPTLCATLPSRIGRNVTLAGNTTLDIVKSFALVMHGLGIWLSFEHNFLKVKESASSFAELNKDLVQFVASLVDHFLGLLGDFLGKAIGNPRVSVKTF